MRGPNPQGKPNQEIKRPPQRGNVKIVHQKIKKKESMSHMTPSDSNIISAARKKQKNSVASISKGQFIAHSAKPQKQFQHLIRQVTSTVNMKQAKYILLEGATGIGIPTIRSVASTQ